jgi:UDP-3-O-[3-hydroxymyristoyl] N-acetylglucosamine deacetylase
MTNQHTLASEAHFSDIGLHSGDPVHMVVGPAPAGSGIQFRVEAPGVEPRTVAARIENLVGTDLCTTLGDGDVTVRTVEHLLAALAGLGIDNALVRLDAGEVPILDGSASPFVDGLLKAGLRAQSAPRTVLKVTAPIRVEDGDDKWVEIAPADREGLTIDLSIDFDHPALGCQDMRFFLTPERFARELAAARTFGFKREVAALQQAGLARGGSLDNAVVLDEDGVMNPGGLRFADEPVRHKVLDLIGDFALLGHPLWGRVTAHRAGHTLHAEAVRALLAHPGRFERREAGAAALAV